MTDFVIRRVLTQVGETRVEAGVVADPPLRKAIVAAVVSNPYAGRYVDDLSDAVEWSVGLGHLLGATARTVLDRPVESYGKGAIVGVAGEQEHGVMLVTTPFGDALREEVGGGRAWIPSTSAVGTAGTPLTVPLAHKDALYVRSHYDAVTLFPDDAPRPDEVVVAVTVASGGRPNHRLGGLEASQVTGDDGLR